MTEASTELFRGDSSDTFSIKCYEDGELVANPIDYTGKLAVMKTLGATPLIEKDMVVEGSALVEKLLPSESQSLAVGNYFLVIEISNSTLNYRREHQVTLKIKKQGYTL